MADPQCGGPVDALDRQRHVDLLVADVAGRDRDLICGGRQQVGSLRLAIPLFVDVDEHRPILMTAGSRHREGRSPQRTQPQRGDTGPNRYLIAPCPGGVDHHLGVVESVPGGDAPPVAVLGDLRCLCMHGDPPSPAADAAQVALVESSHIDVHRPRLHHAPGGIAGAESREQRLGLIGGDQSDCGHHGLRLGGGDFQRRPLILPSHEEQRPGVEQRHFGEAVGGVLEERPTPHGEPPGHQGGVALGEHRRRASRGMVVAGPLPLHQHQADSRLGEGMGHRGTGDPGSHHDDVDPLHGVERRGCQSSSWAAHPSRIAPTSSSATTRPTTRLRAITSRPVTAPMLVPAPVTMNAMAGPVPMPPSTRAATRGKEPSVLT